MATTRAVWVTGAALALAAACSSAGGGGDPGADVEDLAGDPGEVGPEAEVTPDGARTDTWTPVTTWSREDRGEPITTEDLALLGSCASPDRNPTGVAPIDRDQVRASSPGSHPIGSASVTPSPG